MAGQNIARQESQTEYRERGEWSRADVSPHPRSNMSTDWVMPQPHGKNRLIEMG